MEGRGGGVVTCRIQLFLYVKHEPQVYFFKYCGRNRALSFRGGETLVVTEVDKWTVDEWAIDEWTVDLGGDGVLCDEGATVEVTFDPFVIAFFTATSYRLFAK